MNLRLVVENARKYGILISLKSNVSFADFMTGWYLYLSTPCHLFVAYIIERVAMENAKGVIGRAKKNDTAVDGPETEKERQAFRKTWLWIAFAHGVNATLALSVSSLVVYFVIENPGIGIVSELHAIIVWLKICSYAFTNRDLRHAMLHPSDPTAHLPDLYMNCPYPQNITLPNLCYFWWAPTLCYQPYYPQSEKTRWMFVIKRFGEIVALTVFIWLCTVQFAQPVLHNSLDKMVVLDYMSIAERLMKLSTISLIMWLAGFFAIFQSLFNLLAEVLRFGDRVFYEDWWNSHHLRMYWSTWNKPMYHFMRRHIYSPMVGRGWSPNLASIAVFVFSGFLHELAVGVPAHSILGVAFVGMVMQIPVIQVMQPLEGTNSKTAKLFGNCIFWINFVFVGQPLAAMIYFFAWQKSYGEMSRQSSVKVA